MNKILFILVLINLISCSTRVPYKKTESIVTHKFYSESETLRLLGDKAVINRFENCFLKKDIDDREIFTVDDKSYDKAVMHFAKRLLTVRVVVERGTYRDKLIIDYSGDVKFDLETAVCDPIFGGNYMGTEGHLVSFRLARPLKKD
jgi:hypothetical protein